MSKCNVSYFSRIFLGSVLGLCCALFSVPVSANYNNLTWSEIATGFRDTRGIPNAAGNFERISNTSGAYSSLPNNSNYRGGVTLSGMFSSPAKRIPYAGAAVLRPNPVSMGSTVASLLTRNPAVFVGSLAFSTYLSQNGYSLRGNEIVGFPEGTSQSDFLYDAVADVPDYPSGTSGVVTRITLPERKSTTSLAEDNIVSWLGDDIPIYAFMNSNGTYQIRACSRFDRDLNPFVGRQGTTRCVYADSLDSPPRYNPDYDNFMVPVGDFPTDYNIYDDFFSEPETLDVILSNTSPFKSDGSPDFNLNFEVPSESIDLGSSVSTSVADGVTTIKETSSKLDLNSTPSGSVGESGSVVEKETTETKTFVDGQLVSTEQTEESTEDAVLPVPPSVELELPEGCALFDPFCKWAEWTQQDLDAEEPDLSEFMNEFEPTEDGYTLDLGPAVCPDPITVSIAFLGTDLELSYEPVCDLVTMIRPLLIATAYLFAGYIYLGVFRG